MAMIRMTQVRAKDAPGSMIRGRFNLAIGSPKWSSWSKLIIPLIIWYLVAELPWQGSLVAKVVIGPFEGKAECQSALTELEPEFIKNGGSVIGCYSTDPA